MNQKWAYSIDSYDDGLSHITLSPPSGEIKGDAERCLQPSKRGLGPRGPAYSPRDYWAMPDPWYSHRWVDYLIDVIDKERGDKEDTGIPGIIFEDGMFKVFSFFEYEKNYIGEYATLDRAESALIKYNREITKRGHGVDK
jgi:hypothetical protein